LRGGVYRCRDDLVTLFQTADDLDGISRLQAGFHFTFGGSPGFAPFPTAAIFRGGFLRGIGSQNQHKLFALLVPHGARRDR